MTCTDIIRLLSDYLDGELDRKTLREIDRHLEECEECRLLVDNTRKLIQIYCDAKPVPIPASVRKRIYSKLAKKIQKPREAK